MKGIDTRALEKWIEAQDAWVHFTLIAVLALALAAALCWHHRGGLLSWWRSPVRDE